MEICSGGKGLKGRSENGINDLHSKHVQLAEEKFLGNCLAGIKLNTIASVKTEVRASRKANSDS